MLSFLPGARGDFSISLIRAFRDVSVFSLHEEAIAK